MAKKRGISISLAAKCQLLFGLAVLVIIAGALAVPWQRMEQLAGQPNVKAARFAADMIFRQMHVGAIGRGRAWNYMARADMGYARPRVWVVPGGGGDLPEEGGGKDEVAVQALA